MKRIVSLIFALMLLATLSVTAFAAGETGSITINGVGADADYAIYKLLDLESYDVDAGAYAYTVNSDWETFFGTAEAQACFAIDASGYVTLKEGVTDAAVAAFAKQALAYAKTNGIDPVKSSDNAGDFVIEETVGTFSGLELGYYLVDSTVGALCGLTTTNPNAAINAKNGIPTIDKQVNEDSTSQWGAANTADIGQTIEYRVTINVHAGAENYVLHDSMVDGLTFKEVTGIQHVVPSVETTDVDASLYEVKTGTAVTTDGCDFEVHFSKAFCDELETNDKVIVSYTAMLNRNAVINGLGNDNTAWLTFGEGHKSNEDTVTTYTFGIDIVKTDSANKLIDGAQFRIYDAATGGNEVAVVETDAADGYRRARADEAGVDIVVENGKVRVVGLDNGTYYLEETVAPDGYNKLSARQKFIISDANLDAVFNDGIYSTGSGVHVVNKSGSMLPETGGIGTLLFTVLGGTTALGAGVVLVTKKRMSNIKEDDEA